MGRYEIGPGRILPARELETDPRHAYKVEHDEQQVQPAVRAVIAFAAASAGEDPPAPAAPVPA
jgi:hypothetical protein